MLAQSIRRCTSPARVAASAVRSVPEATRQAVVVILESSIKTAHTSASPATPCIPARLQRHRAYQRVSSDTVENVLRPAFGETNELSDCWHQDADPCEPTR